MVDYIRTDKLISLVYSKVVNSKIIDRISKTYNNYHCPMNQEGWEELDIFEQYRRIDRSLLDDSKHTLIIGNNSELFTIINARINNMFDNGIIKEGTVDILTYIPFKDTLVKTTNDPIEKHNVTIERLIKEISKGRVTMSDDLVNNIVSELNNI